MILMPNNNTTDTKQKKAAYLTTFMLSQDYIPAHWDWTDDEKTSLGICLNTANVIYNRLMNAGIPVKEAYAITHDKDEHEIWDEYQNKYITNFTSNHIHFMAKLEKGCTLTDLAGIIGVSENFIEKPKAGRYSYDNLLSYLIHIKYPSKYQYDPHDVVTICGTDYIKYYRENHRNWMHGRAERIAQEAKFRLIDIKMLIMNGEITLEELISDDKYTYIMCQHYGYIEKFWENYKKIIINREAKRLMDEEGLDKVSATIQAMSRYTD